MMETFSPTTNDIISRMSEWYETKLCAIVETPENMGKMLFVDVTSGDYEITVSNERNAIELLRSRRPEALIGGWIIGHDYSQKPLQRTDELKFDWTDTWLLLSIIYAGKMATLKDIIDFGDMLNHAIFTDEEMIGGFARLTAGEFVKEENGVFTTDERVLEAYRSIAKSQPYPIKQTDLLDAWLSNQPAVSIDRYETGKLRYAEFVVTNR